MAGAQKTAAAGVRGGALARQVGTARDVMSQAVPSITLEALLARYDGLLLDAYGVLLDQSGALPGAVALIERLNALNKPWLVVTNAASRGPAALAAAFAARGLAIPPERILTAGALVAPYLTAAGFVGARCLVLGPAAAQAEVARAGGQVVSQSEDAEVLIIADQQDVRWPDDIDAAVNLVIRRCDHRLPLALLLCNPDLLYPLAPGRYGVTAGGIAALIEAVLRERYPERTLSFTRLGKPYAPMFTEARRRLNVARPVMLGDQLHTDIRGALAHGIDAVLVGTGLAPRGDPTTWPIHPTWWLESLVAT